MPLNKGILRGESSEDLDDNRLYKSAVFWPPCLWISDVTKFGCRRHQSRGPCGSLLRTGYVFYVIEQKAEEGNMALFHDTINRKWERASAARAIICLESAEVRTFPSYEFRFI